MGSREAIAGAFFGALAMVAVSVVFAWLTSGPAHEDWSHSAIALTPFAALFGAAAGAVTGLLVRVTRPASRGGRGGSSARSRSKSEPGLLGRRNERRRRG